MSSLETTAEIVKLANALGVERHALNYLSTLPAQEIRRLREATVAQFYAQDRGMFQRLAAASRLLPNALVAKLAEHVFGAMLAARVSGEMPAERAVDIAGRLSVSFLADIARELDPKAARHIIRAMPADVVIPVAREMLARGDFITMGRFVDELALRVLEATLQALTDDEALLHIGFYLESKTRLSAVVNLLPDGRLNNMMQAAQKHPQELWPEALALMAHVDDAAKRRLGDLAAEQNTDVLATLAQVAHAQSLWSDVLPVVARMSESSQAKLMALPILHDSELLAGILHTAEADDLWVYLLPQLRFMSPDQLQRVADATAGLPQRAQEQLIAAARRAGLWEPLLTIVAEIPKAGRKGLERIVTQFAAADGTLVDELAEPAQKHGLGDLLAMARSAVDKAGRQPS
ncbi:MAG: hypothetical protein ABF296_05205 [Oceanococcaceae bacterium]